MHRALRQPPPRTDRGPTRRDRLLHRAPAIYAGADAGAAAVSFILAFPIFLTIVGIVVQIALMVNARIMVQHAADSAARAAATSLPDGQPENIDRAAWISLAPLSPQAADANSQATEDYEALKNLGVNVADSFPKRYAYAMEATSVTYAPHADFAASAGQPVMVTVRYKFQLTVPGIMRLASADDGTLAGVKGRFWEVTATSQVETAHGRKTAADADGWPQ